MALSTQDRLDVMDLVARYAECVDSGDAEGYAGLFTPDGVVEHSAGSVSGRAEIQAWVEALVKENRVGKNSTLKHIMGLPVIRGDGEKSDGADVRDDPAAYGLGRNRDPAGGDVLRRLCEAGRRVAVRQALIDIDFVAHLGVATCFRFMRQPSPPRVPTSPGGA